MLHPIPLRLRAQHCSALWAFALALALLIFLPVTALADDVSPAPPAPPAPIMPGGERAWQDADGNWQVSASEAEMQAANVPSATGGPDDYGYTWDDGAAFNWIDATKGTDTGMSGYGGNQRVGPIALPFTFKYYEGSYNAIYIAGSGYVAFQDASSWPTQVDTPSPGEPNTIISPYSTPLDFAANGTKGRVFYSSGGSAPNRYFVAVWNEVQYGVEDDRHTFEVVLYENGDILFQYKTMTYGPDHRWYCGTVGIEDAEGLTGLQYSRCRQLSSNKAIRFTRPQPTGRVKFGSRGQGVFTQAGDSEYFRVKVINNGELGTDTYKVALNSTWPAQALNAFGSPLTDTDGDGAVDSGPVGQGQSVQLLVRVQTPAVAAVADNNSATLTLQSTRSTGWQRQTVLRTAIPAPFVQAYEDMARPGVQVNYADPQDTGIRRLAQIFADGDTAIAALPGGGHILVWDQWEDGNWYIRYQMLDTNGDPSGPLRALQPSGGGQLAGSAETLAVTVAPDGVIGITWQQIEYLESNGVWLDRYNVLWAALDAAGNQILAPTNLTGNTAFAPWDAPGATRFYYPQIAATGNSRFVVAWETEMRTNGGWISNVFFTMRDSTNSVIKPVTQLSWSSDLGLDNSDFPVLAGLADGRVVLAYRDYTTRDDAGLFVVLSSAGEIVGGPVRLGTRYGYPQAVTQLSTGAILALWVEWEGSLYKSELHYSLLDSSTYVTLAGPTKIDNPATMTGDEYASVAATADGRAVVTWSESYLAFRRYQYYALIGQNGAVLTPATPFLVAKTPADGTLPLLKTNLYGYSIALNRAFDPTSTTLSDPAVTAPALAAGAPGGGAQVQIAVTDFGLPATGNVAVTAELDPQLTYIGATPEPSSVDVAAAYAGAAGPVVHWNLPSLAYLTTGKIVLSTGMPTTTTIGSTFPVTVTVTQAGADADAGNSTVQTQVIAVNQLFLPAAMNNED